MNKRKKKRNGILRAIIVFYDKHNKWPVPTAKEAKERSLGLWISRCRYLRNPLSGHLFQRKTAGFLTDKPADRLPGIPVVGGGKMVLVLIQMCDLLSEKVIQQQRFFLFSRFHFCCFFSDYTLQMSEF